MLGLDSERLEDIGREVLEVLRHDDLGMAANGGSQDVSVVGVRENKPFDERLVSGDEAVGDRFAHQLARPVELGSLEVGRQSRMLRTISSSVWSVQRARKSPVWASRISRSRRPAGWRTFAS